MNERDKQRVSALVLIDSRKTKSQTDQFVFGLFIRLGDLFEKIHLVVQLPSLQ